jgi:transposase InsO family protein
MTSTSDQIEIITSVQRRRRWGAAEKVRIVEETIFRQLPRWVAHYNEVHPHKALGYRSPREFIRARIDP